jgi:2-polyprenyl-3-methyl-5-hydroxy-6-metoxy-1,4-benzoquinol methylase
LIARLGSRGSRFGQNAVFQICSQPDEKGRRMVERYTREAWQKQFNARPDWDAAFRDGEWDYLSSLGEMPRYALIAGYVRKFKPNGTVLDAGCGQAILLDHLDVGLIAYSGFDVSETAIAEARQRAPRARLSICSVEEYQTDRTATFDVIVFNEVLPHVDDPLGTLDRFISILNPEGLVIISLYQNTDQQSRATVLTRILEDEISAGRYSVLTRSRVENGDGLKWAIYCVR